MGKPSRSPIAEAYHWVSVVTTVSLEMVLPAVGGAWLDKEWSTGPWLLIAGAVLGLALAIIHLIQLTHQRSERGNLPEDPQ